MTLITDSLIKADSFNLSIYQNPKPQYYFVIKKNKKSGLILRHKELHSVVFYSLNTIYRVTVIMLYRNFIIFPRVSEVKASTAHYHKLRKLPQS